MIAQDNGESEERVRGLQALLNETQALPQAQAISEDEIAAEIEAYQGSGDYTRERADVLPAQTATQIAERIRENRNE